VLAACPIRTVPI